MADHTELISEIPQVEKMTTQERLKHAKKRRVQQMKKWSQREKEQGKDGATSKRKKTDQNMQKRARKNDSKVHFVASVMLQESAARGDLEEVKRLLAMGVNPDATNEDGLTALHQCCIDNNEEMMKILVEHGANVNAEDSEKWTPLHAAATCGHLNLVKYLISKKANLLAVNADGNMPYDICEEDSTLDYIESEMSKRGVTQELIDNTRSATEILMLDDVKWLVKSNADLEYRDEHGATPLHVAAANGYFSVVEFLLDHNVSTDVVDDDMWQPIHAAACWGHLEVLELLVMNGASLDAKTKNGETPFDICEDIEMKDRMLQLKNEREMQNQTQTQRLRRTQSSNTRSQSVRRTSIRDKVHMTRQEAMEEAKIRLVHQGMSSDTEKSQLEVDKHNRENAEKAFSKPGVDLSNINEAINMRPQLVVAPFQKSPENSDEPNTPTDSQKGELVYIVQSKHQDVDANYVRRQMDAAVEKNSSSEMLDAELSDLSGLSLNNGKASTLADVKRQRRMEMKLGPEATPVSGSKINGFSLEPNHTIANTPPSPSIPIRKFTGPTADDVGAKKKHGCCIIL